MLSTTASTRRANATLVSGAQLESRWALRRAQPEDAVAVKALFLQLHRFNAALDPRFALAPEWEAYFDVAMDEALEARQALCLLIYQPHSARIAGFVLAAVHRDSRRWQHREWVEIEALYVSDDLRGQGCGAALLDATCAWADGVGHPVVQLYVTASNRSALDFYQRQGFRASQAILRKVPA